jgi:hypothetical protein
MGLHLAFALSDEMPMTFTLCAEGPITRALIHLNYLSHQETLGHFLCLVHFIFEMAPLVPQSTAEDLNFENLKPWICQQIHATFPCNYLGLPLSIKKPSRTELQPLLIKIANRLPGWKRNFLTYLGRELLVKTVLPAMPIHFLSVFKLPQWAITNINR